VPEAAYITIFDRDGTSNGRRFELDGRGDDVEYKITSSGEVSEHEFTFEGSMGETICRHFRQCPDYYFSQFDTSDGTLRLPPAVTTVSSLDIAYTPITMWEDFDSDGDRAFYIEYRDTTSTPDIIIKKYRVTDDVLVDTEVSTTQGGAAQETAPRIGKVASFEGNTFVPAGDESGANHLRKIAVGDISAGTADTYTEGDNFSTSHSVIEEDGVSKFVKFDGHEFKTASTTPETDANFSGAFEVGSSGTSVFWSLELGGFVYACTPINLYELDPTSARPLLDIEANRRNKPFQDYDDFDGHMSAVVGAAILYPHRTGFHRYRSGRTLNLSIDNIPGYRQVSAITDIPIGLRHYATDAVGQWVYAIYKPTGFANTGNCNIMVAFYQPGTAKELLWRTLITRTEDLIGLKIDSDKRLWFVQDPNDPAVAAGTLAFVSASSANSTGTSISWSHTVAAGSQRLLRVGISNRATSIFDAVPPTSVQFGSQSLSQVEARSINNISVSMWQLTAPLVATADITATFFASQTGIVGGADDWTGVNQDSPFSGDTRNTGTDTSPTVTVASATGDLVLDVLVVDGSPTATDDGGNSTERWNDTAITPVGAGSSETGAASVVASWSLSGSAVEWAIIAASLQPGALGAADADLNYIQLNGDGSPRTELGRDRGALSSTYEHYMGEVRFDRRVQARHMRVETENFDSTTSLQLKIHRDGGGVDSIGSAITSDDFHQVDFTVGTTDLLRRGRMRLTLDTNSSYAPTVSDPRILRAYLGIRSPDTYKAVMRTGHSIDSARTERKILRQRKGAGTVTITESWSGTQFRADVTSIRDLETRKDANGQLSYLTEIQFRRFDVES